MRADLADEYLGVKRPDAIIKAWRGFSDAWKKYPTNIPMLYTGPHNDAPAKKMSLRFEGTRPGRSWQMDAPGDDLSPCLGKTGDADAYTLDQVIDSFSAMASAWNAALPDYENAIVAASSANADQARHRFEELSTAKMNGLQLHSITNAIAFHRERLRIMAERGLTAPCDVPLDPGIERVMRGELAVLERALPLVDADPRLGYHIDCGAYKYNGPMIRDKIAGLLRQLP
jgi:hypothetical protein